MGVTIAARRGRVALLVSLLAAVAALLPAGAAGATAQAKGLDVSHWNGQIDWIRVASGGYRFVFGKATEGPTIIDPTYPINRAGTEGFGLRFGAYHFARPAGTSDAAATASAIVQADHLVDVAQPQANELPPVLDLEVTGGLAQARLKLWARAWLDEVYARLGIAGLVYASPNFWKTAVGDSPDFAAAGNKLWVAHWTKSSSPLVPGANWGGLGWTFWQWTDCSTVPGFAHCSDGDRMNGPDPGTVAIAAYPTGAPAPSTPPSVVGAPQAGKPLAAVPGIWAGGKPVSFAYQWQRCDAAGAGCQPVTGAIGGSYVPAAADVGHALAVVVTAQTAQGTASASSVSTAAVAAAGAKPGARPAALTAPQIGGLAQAGQVLSAQVGTWSGSPRSFAYQWRRCSGTGTGCLTIAAATAATYTITPGDIGSALSVVVTATGTGGSSSEATSPTAAVAPAPIPAAVQGSEVVQQGVAGNVVTVDGRASVTWQPGSVPNGLAVALGPFAGTLSIAGTEVALGVAGLGPSGFPWPLDVAYAAAQPPATVLGYSTDATIYATVPSLPGPALPAGKTIGAYTASGLVHVLTRVPVRLALFQAGAWGDPSLSSVKGPTLVQRSQVHLLPRSDRSVLVLTRLSSASQVRLVAAVLDPSGARVSILGRGSVLETPLQPGRATKSAQAEVLKPGGIEVRLRLNGRRLVHGGRYQLRVVAADPWGRSSQLVLPFRAP